MRARSWAIVALLVTSLSPNIGFGTGADQGRERAAEEAAKAKAGQSTPDLSQTAEFDASSLIMDMLIHGFLPQSMDYKAHDIAAENLRKSITDLQKASSATGATPYAPVAPEPLPAPVEYDDRVIM